MVAHEGRAPNLTNRWAQYNPSTEPQETESPVAIASAVHPKVSEPTKASISPLTFVKNGAGESIPTAVTSVMSTPNTPTTDNKFGDLHGDETKLTDSRSTRTSRLYSRMSALVSDRRSDHNSMNSLVPVSRYASELDVSDDDDNLEDSDADTKKDGEDSHQLLTMDHGEPVSVLDIMKEINDFQTTLVDRTNASKDTFALTRTQQKLLDLKDLVSNEQGQQASPFKNLLDYSVKIQNEAILSEWTQIRLRFSSHATTKTNICCKAGVLGFVQRYKNLPMSSGELAVTEDEVSDYIQELWVDELLKFSDSQPRVTLATYEEEVDIYKENSMLMSSLARSAMMSRQSTQSH